MIILAIAAYLLGSVPFGLLLSKAQGVDIRKRGSGNIGFANVLRIMGWKVAIPTLVLDVMKGLVPVIIAQYMQINTDGAFLMGLIAIFGHVFPVWIGFRGGKGVATGLGVSLAIQPVAGILGLLLYVLVGGYKKQSSRASLLGVLMVTGCWVYLEPTLWWMPVSLLMIALYTLRRNIIGTVPDYG